MSSSGELTEIGVGYQDYLDPGYFWNFLDPAMIESARCATERAVSYRQFYVGACAAVLLSDRVVFLEGFNNSPRRGSPKRCAEMHILHQTDELTRVHGSIELLDLYVAGPSDPELIKEVTGEATPTLHSCADCRGLLDEHPAANDHTRLVTFGVNPNSPLERQTLREMLDQYSDIEPPKNSRQLIEMAGVLATPALLPQPQYS